MGPHNSAVDNYLSLPSHDGEHAESHPRMMLTASSPARSPVPRHPVRSPSRSGRPGDAAGQEHPGVFPDENFGIYETKDTHLPHDAARGGGITGMFPPFARP